MAVKAADQSRRSDALRARVARSWVFLRSPRAWFRARAHAAEDAWLNAEADAALAEDEPFTPWERVKRDLGL